MWVDRAITTNDLRASAGAEESHVPLGPWAQQLYCGTQNTIVIMLSLFILPLISASLLLSWFSWCLLSYLKDGKKLRQYPSASSLAGLSSIWIMWKNYTHQRSFTTYDAHMKLGKVVRIAPNHLSFISPDAIKDVYGHGTPALKDKFYNAFVGSHPNLLDVRDKEAHGKKRKLFAVALAQKSVEEKEHAIRDDISKLVVQWDKLATLPPKSGESTFPNHDLVDIRRWFNLLMLDLVCDLTFSIKQGFVTQGDDLTTCESVDGRKYLARPEAGTNANLQYVSTLGSGDPNWLRFLQKLFFWHRGVKDGEVFTGYVLHLIRSRFALESGKDAKDFNDFFSGLNYTREGIPIGMDLGELVQECSLLMNAGSETTTCALQNIMYYLIINPRCMQKLYEEVRTVFEDDDNSDSESDSALAAVPSYDRIKFLPYLRACIDETLRHRPSLAIGLPRVTPPEGMYVAGTWVPGETTVSIPTWGMHHDPDVFEKPFEFLPERWLDGGESASNCQRNMLAFSAGSRQCVGRNVAYTEMSLIVATIVNRYEFALSRPDWEPTVYETMVLKSGPMPIKIWRRQKGANKH
ncbi:hypothetical protein LTR47_006858 [Exophiala xenobiotica]|nr:hypothetical protein LTR47_006858 [Exophiala xenobiotica]KAK5390936.1 hypothetical protein LTS03_000307 [Exophiala xenobiotica]